MKLTISTNLMRNVRLFTSHPAIIQFIAPFDRQFQILPGKINFIQIEATTNSEKTQKVLINCVDVNSNQLVNSWLVHLQ